MGTIWALAYANIFMAEFEQKYIYPLIKAWTYNKANHYFCYAIC